MHSIKQFNDAKDEHVKHTEQSFNCWDGKKRTIDFCRRCRLCNRFSFCVCVCVFVLLNETGADIALMRIHAYLLRRAKRVSHWAAVSHARGEDEGQSKKKKCVYICCLQCRSQYTINKRLKSVLCGPFCGNIELAVGDDGGTNVERSDTNTRTHTVDTEKKRTGTKTRQVAEKKNWERSAPFQFFVAPPPPLFYHHLFRNGCDKGFNVNCPTDCDQMKK